MLGQDDWHEKALRLKSVPSKKRNTKSRKNLRVIELLLHLVGGKQVIYVPSTQEEVSHPPIELLMKWADGLSLVSSAYIPKSNRACIRYINV